MVDEQQKKYEEFDKEYKNINNTYDVRNIKKPENYNKLTYENKEKQEYAKKMSEMYKNFSSEIYKLIEKMNKYMNDVKNKKEIISGLKELRTDCMLLYIQSLQEQAKIDNEVHSFNMKKVYENIKFQYKKLKENEIEIKNHDKRILEMMGIFLSIFSVIGLGVTGILNIQDNLPTNILLIMGSILIVVTLLFALIKYDSENKYKFWVLIIFGINLILTGIFFYNPVDKNWEEAKIKIENLEKKLDYEKRINELEKKTK